MKRLRVVCGRLLSVAGALATATASLAIVDQPGTLDPTFGATSAIQGTVVSPSTATIERIEAIVLQPDGKLVVAGTCDGALCVARYDANGVLDLTFGGNTTGRRTVTIPTATNFGSARLALQRDGKIVISGACQLAPTPGSPVANNRFCLVRLMQNGTIEDPTFGNNGRVLTDGFAIATALALRHDGAILVAGGCLNPGGTLTDSRLCVRRYLSDGSLDTTFASGGTLLDTRTGSFSAAAIAIQPDDMFVVAGVCSDADIVFCTRRYERNGQTDTVFGTNGEVATALVSSTSTETRRSVARALVIQPDNKIVVSGDCVLSPTVRDFCMVRYDDSGGLDSTFGVNGIVAPSTFFAAGLSLGTGLGLQSDGKLIVSGGCEVGTSTVFRFCMTRYNDNGVVDRTIHLTSVPPGGVSGKIVQSIGSFGSFADAIAIQNDGRIVLAGNCSPASTGNDFCLARYDGGPFAAENCKPDIDGDGRVLATSDGLINMRIALGLTGAPVANGVNFPAGATRTSWSAIRTYYVTQCGVNLPL